MPDRLENENQDISVSEPQSVCSFLDSLGIDSSEFELIGIETGWQKQVRKKITPAKLITALCMECVDGTPR